MKKPDSLQLEVAAEWLLYNEGDGGEAEGCRVVSQWLTHLAKEDRDREAVKAAVRKIAEENGVTRAAVRAALRKAQRS